MGFHMGMYTMQRRFRELGLEREGLTLIQYHHS